MLRIPDMAAVPVNGKQNLKKICFAKPRHCSYAFKWIIRQALDYGNYEKHRQKKKVTDRIRERNFTMHRPEFYMAKSTFLMQKLQVLHTAGINIMLFYSKVKVAS